MTTKAKTSLPSDGWLPGPDRPLLPEGAVHVWRADLTTVPDDACGLLCSEERARAERMLNEQARTMWMRSRGVLRALLGRYLRKDPRTLRFTTGAHGKPALLGSGPAATTVKLASASALTTSFNLSHSEHLALYAVTSAGAIGVDVELARRRPIDAVGIATRLFGEAEAERLGALDQPARDREFLRAWVRHEAELKCLGTGIGRGDRTVGAHAAWVAELEIGPLGAAAVAGSTRPSELCCWAWR